MKCCDLTAGMLRHRAQIQELVEAGDGYGGIDTSWNTKADVWAFVKPMSGGELINADALSAKIEARAFTRYRSDINETDRLTFDGVNYQIRFVQNLENKNKWLELHLGRGVAT